MSNLTNAEIVALDEESLRLLILSAQADINDANDDIDEMDQDGVGLHSREFQAALRDRRNAISTRCFAENELGKRRRAARRTEEAQILRAVEACRRHHGFADGLAMIAHCHDLLKQGGAR